MTTAISFRLPQITKRYAPTFGLPRGTFGRGIYVPKAIILHALRVSLDTYDGQEYNLFLRDKAEPRHPSVHFGLDYEGNVHQYVEVEDVAWGLWDYTMSNFPTPFSEGPFAWLLTYPDVTPDMYSIHIAAMSGDTGDVYLSPQSILNHARLVAYFCDLYSIPCNPTNVVKHESVDLQFVGDCIGDATYPYAEILSTAQAILTNGGELDVVFEPAPIIDELFGPWTVGISRVSSASYIKA